MNQRARLEGFLLFGGLTIVGAGGVWAQIDQWSHSGGPALSIELFVAVGCLAAAVVVAVVLRRAARIAKKEAR